MNNQSKNKLKATHIDCKIPAHDMIDVCNFDLKVTLLALGRQLADLLYQLKDDCSHISCFSWLVVCCPGGGSSIRTRSASMDDAEGVALTHDSTSLFFTTLMALPKGVAALRQKHEHLILLVDSRRDFQALLKQDMFLLGPAGPSLRRILRNSSKISNSKWAYFFFSILCIFQRKAPCLSFLRATWTRGQTAEFAPSFAVFSFSFGCQMEYVAITQDTGRPDFGPKFRWIWPKTLGIE